MRKNELSTVKALMTMSLNALLADVFDRQLGELSPKLSLKADLGMDQQKQQLLAERIAEYFDGLSVDFSRVDTLEDLFYVVVDREFETIPKNAFK